MQAFYCEHCQGWAPRHHEQTLYPDTKAPLSLHFKPQGKRTGTMPSTSPLKTSMRRSVVRSASHFGSMEVNRSRLHSTATAMGCAPGLDRNALRLEVPEYQEPTARCC